MDASTADCTSANELNELMKCGDFLEHFVEAMAFFASRKASLKMIFELCPWFSGCGYELSNIQERRTHSFRRLGVLVSKASVCECIPWR